MSSQRVAWGVAIIAAIAAAGSMSMVGLSVGSASADPCTDVEVIFARGTYEPPGVGGIGGHFVDAVRAKAGAKTVATYAVNYPASTDWPTAVNGINDAAAHIQATAAQCPKTRMVLGGYSQGAAVMGFVTASVVPAGVDTKTVTGPMPPAIADHVAAVVLFGKPKPEFMHMISEPPVVVGPLYTDKTTDLCAPKDPICSDGGDGAAHASYAANGMVDQAAAFAVSRV